MKRSILTGTLLGLMVSYAAANEPYPARLSGHAFIPAETYIKAPDDAPEDLNVSGKFTTDVRNHGIGSIVGTSNGRETGVPLPFAGQPIQGHSGIKKMSDDTYWVLTDNGAGSKANSPDFMLYLNQYEIDFEGNEFKRLKTIFLHDPDKNVPFRIMNEGTESRYLTGSDFDPESFQFAGGFLWIGDEFGPYLIKADLDGKVLKVFETVVEGEVVKSPDHPSLTTPGAPGGTLDFTVRRSKGFEGMAASPDGKRLYPLLEGALFDPETGEYEAHNSQEYLRILEFDVENERWTGNFWRYPLEQKGLSIGDFNMIDEQYGLIIERDNGEGVVEYRCEGDDESRCFSAKNLPKLKRIYKIKMTAENQNEAVDKIGYIDLMKIEDPLGVTRKDLSDGAFVFPFFTIENVDIVDEETIIVGNDNNLPFSSSREPNRADDNEFILLNVKELLNAK